MKPSSHPDWKPDPQLLAAYFDGELDGREDLADLRARLEAWLEEHPELLAEQQDYARLATIWHYTAPPEPTSETWNSTLRRIEEARKKPVPKPLARPRQPWFTAGACAVGLVLFFGMLFGALRYTQSPRETPSPVVPDAPQAKSPPIAPAEDLEVLPVATASEVSILRVDGNDTESLVVGRLPLDGPLELASPGEIRFFRVQPDARDRMMPHVRLDGPNRPMIWARLDTEK